jgi:hypothetical protein
MHNPQAQGNQYFICDFCASHFDDDRPMVEGHKGALICAPCLTIAYDHVVNKGLGTELAKAFCTLCLEHRDQPQWQSPTRPQANACLRCIKQAASVLAADPDFNWSKPAPPTGQHAAIAPDDDDEIDPDSL